MSILQKSLVCYIMFCRSLFVLLSFFLLAFVLSVLFLLVFVLPVLLLLAFVLPVLLLLAFVLSVLFFFWPLCCLSFFDLRLLITPVLFVNFSHVCIFFHSLEKTKSCGSIQTKISPCVDNVSRKGKST